ncbi:NUDIX domain-containing protein [Cylindrospermopsis raciborskii]|uniref:NUDIX hydrolase n=1 Tax=Cylindrospermopsis raciborskii TaxID=77022 RepID=UPI000778DC32|nr:NUDIX domain-containing protein [Cylindrospermopsis raciborskii]MCZ2201230.1 NUDIX domain-containing protein [Cylindrospermopsis raciborskii PAMP2012]MCZ2205133.1 NUDIX domain-containing protein [Cylindrospermopsis raciborskii PAMP2011]
MNKPGEIRVIVLALIKDGERIFVSEGYDPTKQSTFYRALGGGIEFGETSRMALAREFQEEIQAELTNIRYLGCIENLFIFDGKQGHEIIQLYQCDFGDPKFYQIESLTFSETPQKKHRALWVEISKFKSGELKLVPEIFFDYL